MKVKCQLPYNNCYGEDLINYLKSNKELLHSIYFGFANGSRPIKNLNRTIDEHIEFLASIKKVLDVKLSYVLNSVIPIELNDIDKKVISSGIADIVTIARDDIYTQVKDLTEKLGMKVEYELSRFYTKIEENNDLLKKAASISVYGFEKEIESFSKYDKKFNIKEKSFILNERCYPNCKFKLEHNTNVVLRNLGKTNEKFSCPYKDKRSVFSPDEIRHICDKYNIDILKVCDRNMTDEELLELLKNWFPILNNYNLIGV